MPYAVVAVETLGSWPTEDIEIEYSGRPLTLRPASKTRYATVVVKYQPDTVEAWTEAVSVIRRFLSALAWTSDTAIRDVMSGGGGFPVFLGRPDLPETPTSITISGQWKPELLPEVSGPEARLALALFREALGLEAVSKPYAFLSYAKILNIHFSNGKQQVQWMNDAIPKLQDYLAKQRLAALTQTESDLGEYLYASGRCAVAHANNDPLVDPDEVEDTARLSEDLPVVKALAEHFIETRLGVKTLSTIYREHLYERCPSHFRAGDRGESERRRSV